ncbi:MAG: tol-pal system protein YbgF [Myxococcales bacterium]|jgi:tol-pal system protein YbgF|nr:tol-pal system protein YbgF [Myxococcales bacterium]
MDGRRLAPHAVLLVAVLVAAVGGCATQADVQELQREQRRLRTQLADTRASFDSMQRDVARVRGGVDEVRYSSRGAQSLTTRLDELEARVATLEGRRPASPASLVEATAATSAEGMVGTPVPLPTATPAPATPEIAASDLSREEARELPDDYRRGITLVRQGAYDKAIQALREFLRTNRDSSLAPNAQYWIGESYYMLADYYQAILNFNQVRQQHPKSDRAPAAVLKIGLAFQQMGNKSEARLAFQKVLTDYPSSPEAARAREKLQAL